MKILLVQSTLYVPTHGGENKANRLLLEGLAERGHACRVVAPACGAQGPGTRKQFLDELTLRGLSVATHAVGADVFQQNGVEIYAVTDPSQLRVHVVDQIRDFEPTWVLVSSEDPGQVLLEAALETGPGRVVYVAHTMLFFPFGSNCFIPNQSKTELFRRLAGIITVSNYLKDYLQQWSGCESVVIPFPVYGAGPFPRFGSFDEGFVTIINPCAYKGISIFLELARRMPDVQFAAVPSWGTTTADRAALDQLPNVRLLKARDGIDEIFAETRVLLVPSLWGEGFPLVPVEAMLRGLPVMASDSGGLPESKLGVDYVLPVRTIEHYEQRFDDQKLPIPVVPPQNVTLWEETLRRLLSDRRLYEQLQTASRDAALAYASGLSVAPFEDYLENLASSIQVEPSVAPIQTKEPNSKASDLLKSMDNLSPERRALLALRLKKKAEDSPKTKRTIPRRSQSDSIPLSFSQQRLWFMDQLEPGNPAYNMAWGFFLTGPLDIPVLEQSFNEVVKRHEALRTTFASVNGNPVQVIAPSINLTLPVVDLQGLPLNEREAEMLRLATEESRAPFDLTEGPLIRASLLRLSEDEHMLLLTIHHIVYDLWSMGVLFRELGAIYKALLAGQPAPLAELPIQYADYAAWQHEQLTGGTYERQLDYWRKQLQGAPEVLDLPADRPRPPVQSFNGSHESMSLPKELGEKLRAISQREGVTLFMTLLAAFQILLARYTNQEDIVVGSPIASRTRAELENLIGFFVNNLVLRTDLSGGPSFREVLRRVKDVTLGAYANQDLPFEKIVEELRPERSLSYTPLFQVMFALQNALTEDPHLPGLKLGQLQVNHRTSKFDLTLYMVEEADGLRGRWEYNTDIFDARTIERMISSFHVLLDALLAQPDQRIHTLPLLTAADQHQQLVEWNATHTEYPQDACLHQLFEAHAARHPDAPAVLFEEQRISYQELNQRANRLAHHLRSLGVGIEARVGLCVQRTPEMIIGILGILKAGAAYVPLDPQYPAERLRFMLDDTETQVLLTQAALTVRLPAGAARQQVQVDADAERIAQASSDNPVSGIRSTNLAYVIYTSGSTGVPKGIAIEHRGVVNNITDLNRRFAVGAADRVLGLSSLSFDMCVYEVLGMLAAGGTVVLPDAGRERDAEHWAELVERHAVSVWNSAPSLLEMVVEAAGKQMGAQPERRRLGSLRLALLGGDWVEVTLPERLRAAAGRAVEVVVMGGATEASIHSTIYCVGERDPAWRSIPYGRPMANQQVYVLDVNQQLVPVGVAGELHLGGAGLARGYYNRAELTAERFIPHPFAEGERLYKTGDLVRWRADGCLELLGRMDFQVKLRGLRVELGEVEAALKEQAGVAEAVAAVRADAASGQRLVGYVVEAAGHKVNTGELRRQLQRRMPEYLVPSAIVVLERLPLSANGKVDRRSLPEVEGVRPELAARYVAARNAAEEVVAGIWGEVLGMEQVGVEDNFFELGGHSLLATQVVSRVQEALGVEVPLRSLFESPTVAQLVESIEKTKGSGADLRLPTIAPVSRESYRMKMPSNGVLTSPESLKKSPRKQA